MLTTKRFVETAGSCLGMDCLWLAVHMKCQPGFDKYYMKQAIPCWRFLLSWNILSAIVHQRERPALLDDPCHCVIKLIISFNSLVVLAMFSKNLSVPVFVACRKREKVAYLWYIDRTLLCPTFLCLSFVVQDGIIMDARISSYVRESCALHLSCHTRLSSGTHLYYPSALFIHYNHSTAGVPQGYVFGPVLFSGMPWLPSWGPNEVWTTVLHSVVAVAAQLGFKPVCPGCVLHSPSPWKHSWGGFYPPIPPLPEHHSLSLHKS